LFFKGRRGSGLPGGRQAYADKSLETRYDFEKYRYTYRLWGRLGYNPDADPEVWRRALRQDFGPAALAVEQALASASRVLPLFTLVHGISADCVRYWPEIYTNMPIADEARAPSFMDTRAPKLFGNASPFDPQLFQSPWECGDALVAGKATGKYSPLEAAQWLEALAETAGSQLDQARGQLGAAAGRPEFRRLEEDVLIQRGLALFFAAKLHCAVLWRIHTLTGSPAAGEAAIAVYSKGRDIWAAMAERAKGVYRQEISYGGSLTSGHWSQRVAAFDEDLTDLRQRLKNPVMPVKPVDPAATARALAIATGPFSRPLASATHVPAEKFSAGQPLAIAVQVNGSPVRVTLHYRHLNQAEGWQSVGLTAQGDSFSGAIPAAYTNPRFALQYYFEIWPGETKATLLPPLAADLANFPYYVVRHASVPPNDETISLVFKGRAHQSVELNSFSLIQ
ncbi:MAG: hypothetical protein ABIP85_25705, partial [Chthoniobacteraceae bacterium]